MDFSELKAKVDSFVDAGLPEAQIIIKQNHKEIFRYAAGYSDEKKTKPADFTSLRWMFSLTKPVTAVAVMRLVEQGKLDLDEPIEKYLPTFRDLKHRKHDGSIVPCENELTLRRLLSMTGGYNYVTTDFPHLVEARKNENATTMELISALGYDPLRFDPGTYFSYSLCLDVVAAVIEAAAGKTFGEFLNDEIFTPLEISDTGFNPSKSQLERFSVRANYDTQSNSFALVDNLTNPYKFTKNYESGGAGLFSNAAEYSKFADAIASKGIGHNGYRLLKEETINELKRNQLDEKRLDVFRKVCKNQDRFGYGLGVQTFIDNKDTYTPLGVFGWNGAAGSYVSMDFENGISIVYTEYCYNHSDIYSYGHHSFRELTYKALGFKKN